MASITDKEKQGRKKAAYDKLLFLLFLHNIGFVCIEVNNIAISLWKNIVRI